MWGGGGVNFDTQMQDWIKMNENKFECDPRKTFFAQLENYGFWILEIWELGGGGFSSWLLLLPLSSFLFPLGFCEAKASEPRCLLFFSFF
jgi:hypothetical protein